MKITRNSRTEFVRIAVFAALLVFPLTVCADSQRSQENLVGDLPDSVGDLPVAFSPLTWTTTYDDLGKLFPDYEISGLIPTGYNDVTVKMVIGVDRPDFGKSVLLLARSKNNEVVNIGISTMDSRPACQADVKPKWCRNSYNDELVSIFEENIRIISNIYGDPKTAKDNTGPNSRELTWAGDGFDISLSIESDEFSTWSVKLYAVRNK